MRIVSRFVVSNVIVAIAVGDLLDEGHGALLLPIRPGRVAEGGLVTTIRERCLFRSGGTDSIVGQPPVRFAQLGRWHTVAEVVARDETGAVSCEQLAHGLHVVTLAGSPHVSLPVLGKSIESARELLDAVADSLAGLSERGHLVSTVTLWTTDATKATALAEFARVRVWEGLWTPVDLARSTVVTWLQFTDRAEDPHHVAAVRDEGTEVYVLGQGVESDSGWDGRRDRIDGKSARVTPVNGGAAWSIADAHRHADLNAILVQLGVPRERLESSIVPDGRQGRARAFDLLARYLNFYHPRRADLHLSTVSGGLSGLCATIAGDDWDPSRHGTLPRFAIAFEAELVNVMLNDQVRATELLQLDPSADNSLLLALRPETLGA